MAQPKVKNLRGQDTSAVTSTHYATSMSKRPEQLIQLEVACEY